MNWFIDLGTFSQPAHPYFVWVWTAFVGLVILGFGILHFLGFKFCEGLCSFGMYLTVVTQENSLRRKTRCVSPLIPVVPVSIVVSVPRFVRWNYRHVRWISRIT